MIAVKPNSAFGPKKLYFRIHMCNNLHMRFDAALFIYYFFNYLQTIPDRPLEILKFSSRPKVCVCCLLDPIGIRHTENNFAFFEIDFRILLVRKNVKAMRRELK